MKNIIIGTAGHVDHGKTLLIKALTGMDTDRLKEEKKRGITIELGFAYMDLPDGERAGIIDVPGHEKFIKNMLAGAGGIDMALLIIAADDGVMPQTREHLGILSLLGISQGVVAITKTDLVEPDWLEMIIQDVAAQLKGTFLESAAIIPVSAYTGQGIEQLKSEIFGLSQRISQKNTARPFRIPVDRVFTMDGFGTVITGTLIEGRLSEGDEVEVFPRGVQARVRKLQVHGRDVDAAFAGQRVAVNLAGLRKDELARGDTVAAPGSMEPSMMLDVKLAALKDSPRQIAHGTRLHFYHGAREEVCKLVLLDGDALSPGQQGYAQLRFTQPVAAKKGDRFVVRFYSPVETVGGGTVLDPNPLRHRRRQQSVLDSLKVREGGTAAENLAQAILDASPGLAPLAQVQAALAMDGETFKAELAALEGSGQVVFLSQKCAVHMDYINKLGLRARDLLAAHHRANPLQAGMNISELRGRLVSANGQLLADRLMEALAQRGFLRTDGQRAALPEFRITYSEKDKRLHDAVEAMYLQGGYTPPDLPQVEAAFAKEKAALKQVLEAMQAEGELVMAAPQIYFHGSVVADAKAKAADFTAQKGGFVLADFRDAAGTSRKYALALLEYFDRKGITKKDGDIRTCTGQPL